MVKIEIRTDDDRRWLADGADFGWVLPKPAVWWKRLPVIRKFRAIAATIAIERHYGVYDLLGLVRTGYDEWVVYAIGKGWC